jgi:hypothetical protein
MLHLTLDSRGPAPEPKPRAFFAGAFLVWTRQGILWWIFAVNLILAFLGAHSLAHSLGPNFLNHSLESSRRLVHGFDVTALAELASLPENPLRGMGSIYVIPSFLFTLFMLFMTGGILVAYYDDLRLDAAGFFEACGRHFWRFVRLLIYFLIALIPVAILGSIAGKIYNDIDEAAVSPYSAPIFMLAAVIFLLFLLLCLRLWFDMAQVISMAKDERKMYRMLRCSASLVRHNFGSLFWLYLRISVIGWVLFGVGLYVWMARLRPENTPAAFLVGQLVILSWLGTRLWQRAAETAWYKQYRLAYYAAVPMPPPAPVAPVDIPKAEILPETD